MFNNKVNLYKPKNLQIILQFKAKIKLKLEEK